MSAPGTVPPSPAPSAPPATTVAGIDGFSLAALICALTCCAAPVAVVLGIVGLLRTGPDRLRGRWMAVIGLVVGAALSLMATVVVGIGLLLAATVDDDLDIDDAEVGQCLELGLFGSLAEVSCTTPHDGEIAWAGVMTPVVMREWHRAEYVDDFCYARDLEPQYQATASEQRYGIDYDADSFSGEPKTGRRMICYVTATFGDLRAPLVAPAEPTA